MPQVVQSSESIEYQDVWFEVFYTAYPHHSATHNQPEEGGIEVDDIAIIQDGETFSVWNMLTQEAKDAIVASLLKQLGVLP